MTSYDGEIEAFTSFKRRTGFGEAALVRFDLIGSFVSKNTIDRF